MVLIEDSLPDEIPNLPHESRVQSLQAVKHPIEDEDDSNKEWEPPAKRLPPTIPDGTAACYDLDTFEDSDDEELYQLAEQVDEDLNVCLASFAS